MTEYHIGKRSLFKIGHLDTAERNPLKYNLVYAVNTEIHIQIILNEPPKQERKRLQYFTISIGNSLVKQYTLVKKGGVKKRKHKQLRFLFVKTFRMSEKSKRDKNQRRIDFCRETQTMS